MNFLKALTTHFLNPEPKPAVSPGLYHYERRWPGERARIHLRVEEDGNGLLIVNANRIIHLNATATLLAKLALDQVPLDQAVRTITNHYRTTPAQAKQDMERLAAQIDELCRPDGACPLHELDLEVTIPFSARPAAPYRMDLALTYRCNNDCGHCYNARPRSFPELDVTAWQGILDRLWEIGVPHVVFTGGEPTLRSDLPQLVAYAEKNGQITGINTNGRRLSHPQYLQSLLEAGLDHVQITLESHLPEVHDAIVGCPGAWQQTVRGIENALDSSLFVMTNTTLLRSNAPYLEETLHFLASLGVPTIGLNALIYAGKGATCDSGLSEAELAPLLDAARRITSEHQQRLIWYTPTQYCHFDPMSLELGIKGCTAALYNMCVEPDGSVLPCQSYYQPVGNLLSDPWSRIWNHELCCYLRERRYAPSECQDCPLLVECGGGCPLRNLHIS